MLSIIRTWMKTVLNDLESHNLTLTEAVNVALEVAMQVALHTLSGARQK